jgi:hypothetical protein
MKVTLSSVASLLLVVLGSFQTLVGQPSTPGRRVHSAPFQRASNPNRAQFSNEGRSVVERSAMRPDAAGVLPATFISATRIESDGTATDAVLRGDFNGDGLPDFVTVIHLGTPSLTYIGVVLNGPSLSFASPMLTPVTFAAGDLILAGDINNDGKDDVILVHPSSIDVFISMGDGTFAAPQSANTGITAPAAAALWDVNHDHIPDVVIVDGQSTQAAYLLGNGQGAFGSFQLKSFPAQISLGVLADLDADGNLDLVTNTTLYPGDGKGGFLAGIPFQSSDHQNAGATYSDSVAVGDLNGDGKLDVVTANGNWNTVSIFLNQGGRKLVQSGTSLWSGNNPTALAIADVNWDGKADLVVANAAESDLSVFLGKGDGTFLAPTTEFAIGGSPFTRPVLADFSGDGDLDVVLSDNQSSVVLALGNGDGTFRAASVTNIVVPAGSANSGGAFSIASADLNGDGIPDFVIGQSSTSPGLGVGVFLTQSNGNLGKGVVYAQNTALSYVALGDLNRDGKADIVASNWSTGAVEVLRGNGDGTFQSAILTPLPAISNGVVIADLNGDGWPDVAVAGSNSVVYILLNDGNGSLALAGTYPISGVGYELVAADFNNDGKVDLAVAMTTTSRVALLIGNGNGTFSAAPDYDTTLPSVYGITAGDLDKDGFVDLVITSPGAGALAVAFGNGNGSFNPPAIYAASSLTSQLNPSPGEVALSDVNSDGRPDIVYGNSGYSSVGILLGAGGRRFQGPYEFNSGGGSLAVATADLNKDGWQDIVTADAHFSGLSVLYNATAAQPTPDFTIAANPTAVHVNTGGTTTTSISLSSINSLIGSVQLSCQNLPATLSCTFAPNVVHVAKGQAVTSTLTIAATKSDAVTRASNQFMALAIIPLLGGMFFWRVPRAASRSALLAIVASLMVFSGCQGLSPNKTQSQTYSITVTAVAWNGTSHSVPMQVTVQQQ